MKDAVAVAMSGGVDSSVAAALLKEKGYRVIGVTMDLGSCGLDLESSCKSKSFVSDAKKIAGKLGIEHHVVDLSRIFHRKIIDHFCKEYCLCRTPNPCVRCNQYIKFGALLKIASSLGARRLATGHYARLVKNKKGYFLRKAEDRTKDQSYFLYTLNQSKLARIIFPLAKLTKANVRGLAHKLGLPSAHKPDSQEICFLQGRPYTEFLRDRIKSRIKAGMIYDPCGKILGRHKGTAFYTIGQREGLGIALGYPAYVTDIDRKSNSIIVGRREDAYRKRFIVKDLNLVSGDIKKKIAVKVRIRYNHKEADADIRRMGSRLLVSFKKPQFAITPGQSAVLYDADTVVGGGVIDEVLG